MMMKRIAVLALMAVLLCLPVFAMADIIDKIEITFPEPKDGVVYKPAAITAEFSIIDSIDTLNQDDVNFFVSVNMYSSDEDSSNFVDWDRMADGEEYAAGKHYLLIVDLFYIDGEHTHAFFTDEAGRLIAEKAINGLPNDDSAVQMALEYWNFEENFEDAVLAYKWTLPSESMMPAGPAQKVNADLPKTGDNSSVILWCALACISLLGMAMLARKRKEA